MYMYIYVINESMHALLDCPYTAHLWRNVEIWPRIKCGGNNKNFRKRKKNRYSGKKIQTQNSE